MKYVRHLDLLAFVCVCVCVHMCVACMECTYCLSRHHVIVSTSSRNLKVIMNMAMILV